MATTTETITALQTYSIYIKAMPEAVWDALIRPECTEQYGYRGLADYDLRPGGRAVVHANEGMKAFGLPDIVVDGEVVEADAPYRLVQTWRMTMEPSLAAEGFTRLSYVIEEGRGGVTKLTLTHDLSGAPGLAALVAGEHEGAGAGGGWNEVLSGLKTLLETGAQMASQCGQAAESCPGAGCP
jgi:uncharacterized protein YndB with AHSA1/START domain